MSRRSWTGEALKKRLNENPRRKLQPQDRTSDDEPRLRKVRQAGLKFREELRKTRNRRRRSPADNSPRDQPRTTFWWQLLKSLRRRELRSREFRSLVETSGRILPRPSMETHQRMRKIIRNSSRFCWRTRKSPRKATKRFWRNRSSLTGRRRSTRPQNRPSDPLPRTALCSPPEQELRDWFRPPKFRHRLRPFPSRRKEACEDRDRQKKPERTSAARCKNLQLPNPLRVMQRGLRCDKPSRNP